MQALLHCRRYHGLEGRGNRISEGGQDVIGLIRAGLHHGAHRLGHIFLRALSGTGQFPHRSHRDFARLPAFVDHENPVQDGPDGVGFIPEEGDGVGRELWRDVGGRFEALVEGVGKPPGDAQGVDVETATGRAGPGFVVAAEPETPALVDLPGGQDVEIQPGVILDAAEIIDRDTEPRSQTHFGGRLVIKALAATQLLY